LDSLSPTTPSAAERALEIVSREDLLVLCLRGSLGIADAPALRDAALRFTENVGASGAESACVDLSAVEGVDTGVLQVLAALDAEFARWKWRIIVERPPEAVESQWRKAGWPGFSASR
jgi:anti-anti-sigma regulatory factor